MQNLAKVLCIFGQRCGGKGMLQALLEGHRNLFTMPCPDALAFFLARYFHYYGWKARQNRAVFRLGELFSHLPSAHYIDDYALRGIGQLGLDRNTIVESPFACDIHGAMKRIESEIADLDGQDFTAENVFDIFFRNYEIAMTGKPPSSDIKFRASVFLPEVRELFEYDGMSRSFPECKILCIKRDPEEAIVSDALFHMFGTTSSAIAENRDLSPSQIFDYVESYVNSGAPDEVWVGNQCYAILAAENPELCKIINFNEMIRNVEKTMRGVADWLDIPFDPILTRTTLQGREFKAPDGGTTLRDSADTEFAMGKHRKDLEKIICHRLSLLQPQVNRTMRTRRALVDLHRQIMTGHKNGEKSIAIYGMGEWGTKLLHMMLQDGVEVRYAFDTNRRENELIFGTPTSIARPYDPNIGEEEKVEIPVYVAVENPAVQKDIARILELSGWKRVYFPPKM